MENLQVKDILEIFDIWKYGNPEALDFVNQLSSVEIYQEFKTVFGKPIEDYLDEHSLQLQEINFEGYDLNIQDKLRLISLILATDIEIEGWNGRLHLDNNHIINIDNLAKALETNETLNVLM